MSVERSDQIMFAKGPLCIVKLDGWMDGTDRPTDRPTDGPMNQPMDEAKLFLWVYKFSIKSNSI